MCVRLIVSSMKNVANIHYSAETSLVLMTIHHKIRACGGILAMGISYTTVTYRGLVFLGDYLVRKKVQAMSKSVSSISLTYINHFPKLN